MNRVTGINAECTIEFLYVRLRCCSMYCDPLFPLSLFRLRSSLTSLPLANHLETSTLVTRTTPPV